MMGTELAVQTTQGLEVQRQTPTLTLKGVTDRVNLVHQVLEKVMHKGTHYGTVPGCGDKFVLLKPGADVLAMTFRLVPQYQVSRNDLENGHREYDVTCSMYGPDGALLGQGVGSASTMEKKYRYRWEGQGSHRTKIENEDIADVYNTVLKMAKKRAHVDATLTVTGAADLFTQDLIDEDEAPPRPPVSMPVEKAPTTQPPAPKVAERKGETEGAQVVQGLVEDISVKTGTKRTGESWTRYGIKVNGQYYGTFSVGVNADAEEAKASGCEVRIEYETDAKGFHNIDSLTVVPPPANGAPEPDKAEANQ